MQSENVFLDRFGVSRRARRRSDFTVKCSSEMNSQIVSKFRVEPRRRVVFAGNAVRKLNLDRFEVSRQVALLNYVSPRNAVRK